MAEGRYLRRSSSPITEEDESLNEMVVSSNAVYFIVVLCQDIKRCVVSFSFDSFKYIKRLCKQTELAQFKISASFSCTEGVNLTGTSLK